MWRGTFLTLLVSLLVALEQSHTSAQECGGILYQDSGTVASPNYPSYYPNSQRCAWAINVAQGKVVSLSFQRVELSDGQSGFCRDSVQVYDGINAESALLGQMCGFKNQTELEATHLQSSGNKMYITFTSDSQRGGRGFIGSFHSLECDAFMYGENSCNLPCNCVRENSLACDNIDGTCICKPGWTSNNCSQPQCKDRNCPYLCRVTSTNPWTEECHCPPWMIPVASNNSQCHDRYACNRTISDQSGHLASPGYPTRYPDNGQCSWTIAGSTNRVISLRFSDFMLSSGSSCYYGSVSVYDGSNDRARLIGQYCGDENIPGVVRTTGRYMHIVLQSRGSYSEGGFSAAFSSHVCPAFRYGEETCSNICQCVQSHSQSCNSTTGECICQPGWTGTDCSEDINECAGTTNPCPDYKDCRNTPGSYECVQIYAFPSCNRSVSGSYGYIATPNFPAVYNNNVNCYWTIYGSYTVVLRVDEFNLETHSQCSFDSMDVYDGYSTSSPKFGHYCNSSVPKVFVSSGNRLHIRFKTDRSVVRQGFRLTYQVNTRSGCNWTLNKPSGFLASTNYPNSYTNNLLCSWTITAASNKVISLRFDAFELESNSDCSWDYVRVYNGSSTSSPLLGQFCGNRLPAMIRSTSNRMHIVFRTDGSIVKRGFSASYISHECPQFMYGSTCASNCSCRQDTTQYCNNTNGQCVCKPGWSGSRCTFTTNQCSPNPCYGNLNCFEMQGSYQCRCPNGLYPNANSQCNSCSQRLTQSYGTFTSPAYPQNYADNTACNWTIVAPTNHIVTLRSNFFNLEDASDCVFDSLQVYDGGPSDHLIGKFCGTVMPDLVRSSGNTMFIAFVTDHSVTEPGFSVIYETHACPNFMYGSICQRSCSCIQNTTDFCDSLTGVCVCKPGWMGPDCSQDIDECQFPESNNCSLDTVCTNEQGNYSCNCREGYARNASTGLCEVDSNCKRKPCSHSCIRIVKEETCLCPNDYFELDGAGLQCIVPYYPYGVNASGDSVVSALSSSEGAGKGVSSPIQFAGGAPFGNNLETEAYVIYNGVISFGNKEIPQTPNWTEAGRQQLKLLAPFWTPINLSTGKMFYHLYEKCDSQMFNASSQSSTSHPKKTEIMERARRDVTKFHNLADFDVNTVLVATWYSVEPVRSQNDNSDYPHNTFQAVYISGYPRETSSDGVTGSERAYVIYIYQHGQMNWPQTAEERPVKTGYNTNGYFWDLGANGINLHNRIWNTAPYQSDIRELYKCPCTLDRLGRQWESYYDYNRRSGDIYCYAISSRAKSRLLQNNPRNKLCCYQWTRQSSQTYTESRRQASYITASADAGHILIADPWGWRNPESYRAARENLWAHQECCGGGDSSQCNKFYRVFPDMGCSNVVTFVTARELGDPHIITFDLLNYTMNGLGEYTLADVPDENFVLQARTGIALTAEGEETNATVFTAFAAEEDDNIHFQVELTNSRESMIIYVDEEDVTNSFYADPDYTYSTEDIAVVREVISNKTNVIATFPCGVTIKVVVGVRSLEITLEVDNSLQNKTQGLLGNFNGDPHDDFQLPNGTVLPSNLTEREIFYQFAKEYELTSATSVFLYFGNESSDDYLHPEFVPKFTGDIDNATLAATERTCRGSRSCIYDYAVTRDEIFAANSRDSQHEINIIIENAANNLPTISAIHGDNFEGRIWEVTVGTSSTLQIVAADEDGDAITFDIENPPSEMTINNNGLLTYTPSLTPIASFRVRVIDSKGAYSAYRDIAVMTCTGCNGHGTCDRSATRTIRTGDVDVRFMRCNCLPAYGGDDCELDRDGCASMPCSAGQDCTDIPAEEQGDSDIGFECGPCPPGFLRTNITCDSDINECADNNPCQQECINTYGSYRCGCGAGYRLNIQDSQTCIDVDECEERTSGCEQGCSNSDGNFTCTCASGYTLNSDERTCSLDPSHSAACQQCDQVCSITSSGAECSCRLGYQVDPNDETQCLDVNECDSGNNPCTQTCVNTPGSFQCACNAGFRLDSDGVSCTGCRSPYYGNNCSSTCNCFGRGSCNSVTGCVCNAGWSGVNCNQDVDECLQSNVCPDGQVCQNEQGSFSCVCSSGYRMENGACVDINECTDRLVIPDCDVSLETCVNTDGSYRCECKQGYTRGNGTECVDIDECQQEGHGCQHICENRPGTYSCKCEAGFKLADDRHSCWKPCRCVQRNVDFCNTTNGHCTCKPGWTGSDCSVDIDECLSNPCPDYLECINMLNGLHACRCYNGFPPADDNSCNDCNRTITDATGTITSPNYPRSYSNDTLCTWTIRAADNHATVSLRFQNYDVEGYPYDYVEIYDGLNKQAPLIGQYRDADSVASVIESTTNAMHVVFMSDESVTQSGFRASYSSLLHCKSSNCSHTCNVTSTSPWTEQCMCPEWMTLDPTDDGTCVITNVCNSTSTALSGVIVSPNYPRVYPDETLCTWEIKGEENNYVTLSITDLLMEGSEDCSYDYLAVYDGGNQNATLLGRYCGQINSVTLQSTGTSLFMVFYADDSVGAGGFKANYTLNAAESVAILA